MNTCRPITDPSRRQFLAREYFAMRTRKMASYIENLDIIEPPLNDNGWADDGHPTREYTEELLIKMTKDLVDDVLLDPRVLTSERMYRGVTGHYLSGCTGCTSYGFFTEGGFCGDCLQGMSSQKKLADDKIFKKVLAMALQKYPQNGKRQHSEDEEDNVPRKS